MLHWGKCRNYIPLTILTTSSDRNARRHAIYASMNAVSLDSATDLPTRCKGEASRPTRGRTKYHAQGIFLKRMETIFTEAWSLPPVEADQICGVARYLRESRGFSCLHGQALAI
ncbi:hypothetical protein OROHE_021975 [Orobanche hederae]